MDDITSLRQSISDLKTQIETLQQLSPHEPSLFETIKAKLSEQGSQRGIIMIVIAITTRLGLDNQLTLDILAGLASIYGIHNVITDG